MKHETGEGVRWRRRERLQRESSERTMGWDGMGLDGMLWRLEGDSEGGGGEEGKAG